MTYETERERKKEKRSHTFGIRATVSLNNPISLRERGNNTARVP